MINQEQLVQLWASAMVDQGRLRRWDPEKIDDIVSAVFLGMRKMLSESIAQKHADFYKVISLIDENDAHVEEDSFDYQGALTHELKTILGYAHDGQVASEPHYRLLVGFYYAFACNYFPSFPSIQQARESALWGIHTYETNDLDPLQDELCWITLCITMWLMDYNGFRAQAREQFPKNVQYALKEEHEMRKQERREAMKDFGSDAYRSPRQREADRKAAIPGVAPAGTGKKEESGGCYVATAVYGSYDCPEVWVLRRYRDGHLAKSLHGRAFIRTYYAVSPTFVRWFGDASWFKRLVRPRLDAMVAKLENDGYSRDPYDDQKW